MEMLALKDINDFQNLKPNKWKIREFPHSEDPNTIYSERENGKSQLKRTKFAIKAYSNKMEVQYVRMEC